MKKKLLILLLILVSPILLLVLFLLKEELVQSYANNAIKKANYCTYDTDCVETRWCQFINRKEEEKVNKSLEWYDKLISFKLATDCMYTNGAQCASNKCQPIR